MEKNKIEKKLVIDRQKWLRGEGIYYSKLLRKSDRKMCCLGFYLLSCGEVEAELLDNSEPVDLPEIPKEARWLQGDTGRNSSTCSDLMAINDSQQITEQQRESEIQGLFRSQNIEVTFIN